AGGGSPCAGRVEVKLRGRWGSVGDNIWDMEDAEVVCQHLGCGSAAGAYSAREIFGAGDGPLSLADVDCKGNESTLWDCEIRGWGPYGGLHNFDTAVTCQGRSRTGEDVALHARFSRLVGGDGACAGRLEVRQGRAWVGVCEDQVDMKVAQVVCRELGCGAALSIPGSERFGAGSGPLWDGGFQCNGTEPLLSACARHRPHSQGCSTGPASVICSRNSSGCTGRVEVAVRGTWGSVCASEWELADAHVLCRHLGCGRAFTVPPGGSFGSGDGPLRPDAFGCSGSERHPGECPVAVLGKPPCAPGNAAAVNCSGIVESLELVEGETRCDGWLELAISTGTWRRVPGELLSVWNFSNVCSEMGCGGLDKSIAVRGEDILRNIDEKERAVIERVIETMQGMTTELTGAYYTFGYWFKMNVVTTAPPGISHGAAIVCSGGCPEKGWRWRWPRQPPQPGASVAAGSRRVRLVGSSGRCAGRVEVYSGGTWSAVCQEGWELRDAAVVCRELGCGTALEAPSWARFGAGPGPLWPYIPACSGSEESLWECGRSEGRECGRGGGAGAVCSEQLSVRLAGGRGRCRGFLEVSHNGTWGRVCADGTSPGTANTVCQQLGCGPRGWLSAGALVLLLPPLARALPRHPLAARGSAPGPWGRWRRWGCWCARSCVRVSAGRRERGPRRWRARLSSLRAAGSGELRLVGGGGRCAGRVEVKHGGEWGSVCVFDFDWEARWAIVVCRQLGCGRVAKASPYAPFGQGTGRIWLQPVCRGTEEALEECPEGDVGLRVRQRVGAGRCARPVPPPGLRPRLHRAPGRLLWQRGRATAAGRLRLQRERAAPGRVPRGRAGEAPLCPRKRRCRQLLRCVRHLREVHEGLLGPPRNWEQRMQGCCVGKG
uniref:Uncharacterized protein n=1 Tax=Corvus moneduloides TaxID=1196302 RepID=A0A8U7NNP5_CORMO